MMRLLRAAFVAVMVITLSPITELSQMASARVATPLTLKIRENTQLVLSPVWSPMIQQWGTHVGILAKVYGLDPDLIAAVIERESNGDPLAVSQAGAVGLMGVMPTGPGLEWRPLAEDLINPTTNLRWGVAILSEIIRQSGGDFYAALAAYSGGWDQVNSRVTRHYAASVLDSYGRAVAARNSISPDIATQWTIAIKIRRGHVPTDPLLVLGEQPVSGLHIYGEHTVYNYVDRTGRAYYVQGYAVPVALVVPLADVTLFGSSDSVEEQLQSRLGLVSEKIAYNNPHVLIACLPSLSRLRGHASTRWYAPSYCPSWHR